jgi:hypothetical protein
MWRRAVYANPDLPEGSVDRDASGMCVLEQLMRALHRRDIFASPSHRWSDPRARLLDGQQWQAVREDVLNGLGLETSIEHTSLVALLTSEACNIGLSAVINSHDRALTRDRLAHVDRYYLRGDTLAAANALLIKAPDRLALGRRAARLGGRADLTLGADQVVGRCQGAQDIELVALGIGHDHPAPAGALTHVHFGGTEAEQSGHLVVGAAVDRADVEVKPVLHGLALGHLYEHQSGRHLAGPDLLDGRYPGADLDLALCPLDHLEVQDLTPEGRESLRIVAVNDQLGEPTCHVSLLRVMPPMRQALDRYDHWPLESIA